MTLRCQRPDGNKLAERGIASGSGSASGRLRTGRSCRTRPARQVALSVAVLALAFALCMPWLLVPQSTAVDVLQFIYGAFLGVCVLWAWAVIWGWWVA